MGRTLIICLAAAVLFAACTSAEEDICDGKCACEGCTPGEHSECLQDLDGDRAAAEFRGCVPSYHDLASCQAATGTCIGGDWKTSCKPEQDRYKTCVDAK